VSRKALLLLVCQLQQRLGGDAAEDFFTDLIERQNFFRQSSACDEARHAPDDARRLVLYDHGSSYRT
jgi:hypothetical protein